MTQTKPPRVDDLLPPMVGPGPRDTTCAICCEDLEEDSTNVIHKGLPNYSGCQRTFCIACIQSWSADRLVNGSTFTCPMCRAVLGPIPQRDHPDHSDFTVTHSEQSLVDGSISEQIGLINWGFDDQSHANHGCIHWSKVFTEVVKHARDHESQAVYNEHLEQVKTAIMNEGRAAERLLNDTSISRRVNFPHGDHNIPVITIIPDDGQEQRFPFAPTAYLLKDYYTAAFRVNRLLHYSDRTAIDKAMLDNLRRQANIPKTVMSQLRQYAVPDAQKLQSPALCFEYWLRLKHRGSSGDKVDVIEVDIRQGCPTGRWTRPVYFWVDPNPAVSN